MSTRWQVVEYDKETGETTKLEPTRTLIRQAMEDAVDRHYARTKEERARYGLEVVPVEVER